MLEARKKGGGKEDVKKRRYEILLMSHNTEKFTASNRKITQTVVKYEFNVIKKQSSSLNDEMEYMRDEENENIFKMSLFTRVFLIFLQYIFINLLHPDFPFFNYNKYKVCNVYNIFVLIMNEQLIWLV